MLNRAAFFATMVAGTALATAVLTAQSGVAAAEPQTTSRMAYVEVLEHAAAGWHLVREGDDAKLAYGIAGTDQVLVMLRCAAGADQVEVFGQVTPETRAIRLSSAALSTTTAVVPQADPLTGGMIVHANLPSNADALEGFRESGRLALTSGEATSVPAHAVRAEMPHIRAFFDHCDQRSI